MANTYKKPSIAVEVTTVMGVKFTDSDAEGAVQAFNGKKIVEIKGEEGNTILIPYHAIQTFKATVSDETRDCE